MGDGVSWLTVLAIVLLAWGAIALFRKILERGPDPPRAGDVGVRDVHAADTADDEIDYEELERAEEEVRDLDVNARPEDGFEEDDWGPGVPQPPKPPPY